MEGLIKINHQRSELLHEELLSQWKTQSQKSKDFQEQGREKLEESIRQGQNEVRQLIRRLRDGSADGEIARRTGKRLKQMEIDYKKETILKENIGWTPRIGERVRLVSINKPGEIVDISEDGLQITVLCGVFRSIVELSSIESLDGVKPCLRVSTVKVNTSVQLTSNAEVRTRRNTVDVRGLRVHEAESVIEEQLRNTLGPLWVIHGIGTGKLRRGLLQWLETLEYVEKVTIAEQGDGGAGCSVIWMK